MSNIDNSFRYYKNLDCKYFPCHKVESSEVFNCMFCYCPLYFLKECGGYYKISSGIKDCTDCIIPHKYSGYDYINKKIVEENAKKRNNDINK